MAKPAGSKPNTYRIAVIPGDGIGNEVVPEGIKVLEAVGHPQPLTVDRVDRAPIHGRRARAHLFVEAIAVADAFNKRQTRGKLETYLPAGNVVTTSRIARGRPTRGELADRRAFRLYAVYENYGLLPATGTKKGQSVSVRSSASDSSVSHTACCAVERREAVRHALRPSTSVRQCGEKITSTTGWPVTR